MKTKFKFLSLLLCASLLLGSFSVLSFAEGETGGLIGDVDGDGSVTTLDARIILKMASSIIPEDLTAGDMNGDGIISIDDATQALIKASSVGGVVIPNKNGDNFLCDYSMEPNNEFLNLIISKYNVDRNSLVAIYSVPDSGTNYVLQFKKSKGVYVKSPDTLDKVYHIGAAPERKISYTSGSIFGVGDYNCEPGEGLIVFSLIKTQVMPQYPDYFTGV